MRYASLALIVALGSGDAWAQPEPAGTGSGSGSEPADAKAPVGTAPAPGTTTAPATTAAPAATTAPASTAPANAANGVPASASPATTGEDHLATKPPTQQVLTEDVVSLGRDRGLRFGSYGRVVAGTDLRGGKPEKILVVAHGPRIVEDSYLELDFSYGFETPRGVKLRPVITLAFDGTLFHDTGSFDAHPALRNMFLDANVTPNVTAWVGSRMYRGDDIYLFDYWPLDDLNTVGGGVFYKSPLPHDMVGNAVEVAAHAGVNRLNVPFQYQTVEVPDPAQGATTVTQLNRQRMIASATAAYLKLGGPSALNLKAKIHGELHELPSGTRKRDDGSFQALPSDSGYLIGAELSAFGMADPALGYRRHLNLFMRYAKGLAAFDELAPPTTFGSDLTTQHANEFTFGLSGNWDAALGNMMVGALSRHFTDATGNDNTINNGWEYALDARPLARLAPDWFAGADVSYQARFPRGLNPNAQIAEDASVFEIAPMVVFSPMGPSAYDRPQLRAVFRAAHLDQGALDLYVPGDPRHGHPWQYFLGLQAEWWFNSSTYR